MPHRMQDLSSLTRDQTCPPSVEEQRLGHWTTGESQFFLIIFLLTWAFEAVKSLYLYTFPQN